MKPSEIYGLKPIYVTDNINYLVDCWRPHVLELDGLHIDSDKKNERIDIRIYFDPYIDGERCFTIGAAYFDGKPVMIFRHAGRGGHDEYDEFVTDSELYNKMVEYLLTFVQKVEMDCVSVDEDVEALNYFHGRNLSVVDGAIHKL